MCSATVTHGSVILCCYIWLHMTTKQRNSCLPGKLSRVSKPKIQFFISTWPLTLLPNNRNGKAWRGMTTCFPSVESLSWREADPFCVLQKSSELQLPRRSDRDVQHQGQGSHLKVTFQSTQHMLPVLFSLALPAAVILHPYLSLCLTFLSFGFLLLPPTFSFCPPSTSPSFSTIPWSVICWRGSGEKLA